VSRICFRRPEDRGLPNGSDIDPQAAPAAGLGLGDAEIDGTQLSRVGNERLAKGAIRGQMSLRGGIIDLVDDVLRCGWARGEQEQGQDGQSRRGEQGEQITALPCGERSRPVQHDGGSLLGRLGLGCRCAVSL
jgi:hypothetical protein